MDSITTTEAIRCGLLIVTGLLACFLAWAALGNHEGEGVQRDPVDDERGRE